VGIVTISASAMVVCEVAGAVVSAGSRASSKAWPGVCLAHEKARRSAVLTYRASWGSWGMWRLCTVRYVIGERGFHGLLLVFSGFSGRGAVLGERRGDLRTCGFRSFVATADGERERSAFRMDPRINATSPDGGVSLNRGGRARNCGKFPQSAASFSLAMAAFRSDQTFWRFSGV
jgi:hypothetical protein